MESKRLNSKVVHSEIYYNTKEERPCSFGGSDSRGVKSGVSGEKESGRYLSRLAQKLRDPSQVLKAGCLFGNCLYSILQSAHFANADFGHWGAWLPPATLPYYTEFSSRLTGSMLQESRWVKLESKAYKFMESVGQSCWL